MAQDHDRSDRPRVGLALSGGAARGIAHVGVLRAFEEHAIPVDAIAGASAGALIGGAYAAGLSIKQLEELALKFRWRHMARLSFSRLGLQSNARMENFLRARLPVTRFEELKIPFAAMVTDLRKGTPLALRDAGDVAFAIRASCCLPAFHVPVRDGDGRLLVDGGLVANLPISYTRDLGADIVIAVDVGADGARFMEAPRTALGVLTLVFVAVERVVSNQESKDADLIIIPKVGHIRWDETRRADELLTAGYDATLESIESIKELIERYALNQKPSESFV
ncbi:MAG TPA: patatin-like phospholipase family protein [Pyrinomonadaceae bacterium]|nr:patatin-like phospholipase family protein [Pyrinomonadaceae bacterium]